MVSEPILQWLFTVVFAATGLHAGWNMIATRSVQPLVGHAFHLLMSLAMIVMMWPWGTLVPTLPQVIIFAAGALWFLILLIRRISVGDDGHNRWYLVSHVVMMAAMVWMAISMGSMESTAGHEHHHGVESAGEGITWAILIAPLMAFGMIMAADFLLSLRQRGPRSRLVRDTATDSLMNLGMAGSSLPMFFT